MKKILHGFTMIEVAIFLVITGALFVGIAVGTQNSIFQQRYNDAVQNFAEFLRTVYSETTNVQSEGAGRSEKAIYGKLVTFGESYDLSGEAIEAGNSAIFSYNVIGDIDDLDVGNLLETLRDLDTNVVIKDGDQYRPVGLATSYKPRWASAIQGIGSTDNFKGALLVVRHPSSGTVYTFVMEGETVEVNEAVREANASGGTIGNVNPLKKFLQYRTVDEEGIEEDGFEVRAVDFCVNPNGVGEGGLRRDVRIIKGARNGSAVEIIGDGEGDRCQL